MWCSSRSFLLHKVSVCNYVLKVSGFASKKKGFNFLVFFTQWTCFLCVCVLKGIQEKVRSLFVSFSRFLCTHSECVFLCVNSKWAVQEKSWCSCTVLQENLHFDFTHSISVFVCAKSVWFSFSQIKFRVQDYVWWSPSWAISPIHLHTLFKNPF